jgi:uncharacterized repeat protein (TIGR01451 family)
VTITGTVAPDAQPNAGADVANTAVATTSTALLGGGGSVSSTAAAPLTRSADLAVTKSADATSVAAGGGVTFTVTVTNTGPSDATGTVVSDRLPAPFEFDAAGSDAECSVVAGSLQCAVGTLAAGATRALTIAATLPPDAAPNPVTNTASVTSAVPDPDGSNDSASVPVEVVQAADLSVTKTAAAEGVLLGGTMTYALTVVNDGPSNAAGVILTDTIPAGTTVTTLPDGCTFDGSTITCPLGDLAAGGAVSLDVVLAVPDTLQPGPLPNTASVTSSTPDPDPDDNAAEATVEAVAESDVTLTKELITDPPVAGAPVQYRLTLFNHGPTVAPNASLSDPIPAGTTFVSFVPDDPAGTCQLDPLEDVPAASCTLGLLAVDASTSAILTVDTDPAASTVTNTGFGGSGGLDPAPADNEDTAVTALVPRADLSITKRGPAAVSAATPATYTLDYRNDGPSTATEVVVTDTVSDGLMLRRQDGCTISGQTISCAAGNVAPGGSGSITITADVDPALALGSALTDVASIDSGAAGFADPDATDNSAQLASTVEAQNDVAVTVTAGQREVLAGAEVTYTVVVTNNGPQLASDVTLANALPPEVATPTFTLGSGRALPMQVPTGCLPTGATATCMLGDLGVGASRAVVFGGTVAAGTPAGTRLTDTATVSFDGTDAVEANNRDEDTILVVAPTQQTSTTSTTAPGATTTTTHRGSGAGGGLPATGAAIATVLAAGALLLVFGGGLRGLASRRRRS